MTVLPFKQTNETHKIEILNSPARDRGPWLPIRASIYHTPLPQEPSIPTGCDLDKTSRDIYRGIANHDADVGEFDMETSFVRSNAWHRSHGRCPLTCPAWDCDHHSEFAVADSKLYVCSTAPRWVHRAHPGVIWAHRGADLLYNIIIIRCNYNSYALLMQ